jgi:hypothetical protein
MLFSKRHVFLLAVFLTLAAPTAWAQTESGRLQDHNAHAWLMYFSDARLLERWGVHTEAQLRRSELGASSQQNFVRLGGNYYVSPRLMLTAGYAYALTYPYGDYPVASRFPEHRIYQQVLLRDALGRVQFTHRYRLEQRWVRFAGAEDYTYLNRTRYQLRLTVPLGPARQTQPGTPYIAAYDEVFVNFGRNVARNTFDQNRAYLALGFQVSKATSLEAGYLHQLVQQGNGTVFEHNHTLQFSLNFNPDFRPKSAESAVPTGQ